MMFIQIEFRHFFSKRNFCELQRTFASQDIHNRYSGQSWDEPKEELKINGALQFSSDSEKIFEFERDFYDDFVRPSLATLAAEHIEMIQSIWKTENIWAQEQRKESSEEIMKMIKDGRRQMMQLHFLPTEIKNLVDRELTEFEEMLLELTERPYLEVEPKLRFNWYRADVECFFYLLMKKKQIQNLSDAQLGRIIDNVCECIPDDDSPKHIKITGARKHLNHLKNEERNPDNSIKRLKKNLGENFFNI